MINRNKPTNKTMPKRSSSKRAGLILPVAKFGSLLRKRKFAAKVSKTAEIFLAGVIEYVTAEIIGAAGKEASAIKAKRIAPIHLERAVKADMDLRKLTSMTSIDFRESRKRRA